MKIVFTLCSNNYLAQAKSLGDSIVKFNPDYKFIIGLVDELSKRVDYTFFEPYIIIPVANIGIPDFDNLWKKYNIIEFNTSVKASYFKHIFEVYEHAEYILYFDPDILIFHSLKVLENEFINNELLITPHILSPIQIDGNSPSENLFLNYGLYNLGFIGVHRNCLVKDGFLDWWENRTLTAGFIDPGNGIFVDQLYINFIPLFFKKVKILKHLGLNVAPWNLHERSIFTTTNGYFIMPDNSPLYFYHFSSYRFSTPEKIASSYNRYNFNTHPELIKLYADYHKDLLRNKIEHFSEISCEYVEKRKQYQQSIIKLPSRKQKIYGRIKSLLKHLYQ